MGSGGQVNGLNGCHETIVIGLERLGGLQMQTDKDGAGTRGGQPQRQLQQIATTSSLEAGTRDKNEHSPGTEGLTEAQDEYNARRMNTGRHGHTVWSMKLQGPDGRGGGKRR